MRKRLDEHFTVCSGRMELVRVLPPITDNHTYEHWRKRGCGHLDTVDRLSEIFAEFNVKKVIIGGSDQFITLMIS